MGHRPVGVVLRYVQHKELMILAGHEKAGGADGLAVVQGRDLVEALVVFQGKDRQRHWHVQLLANQELSEHGSHLLEAHSDLTALLLSRVRDDREMSGVNFKILGFGTPGWT